MTEREQYQMFLALYELLYDQEEIVNETTIVAQAIYKALCDTLPDFEWHYSKYHRELTLGEQGQLNAAKLRELATIIEVLKKKT